MARKEYSDPLYRENRRKLLADDPRCVWCKTRKATTADHLIELDRGGTNEASNLVAACAKCNSARGSTYQAKKREALIAQRKRALGATPNEKAKEIEKTPETFLNECSSTPSPSVFVSPKVGRSRSRSVASVPLPPEDGPVPARLSTPRSGEESFGPQVAEWTRRILDVELMPWQIEALTHALSFHRDENGEPVLDVRRHLTSVSRQSGKSFAIRSLVGWWLSELAVERGRPQLVISTAHKLDLAVALFQDLAPVLEAKFGAKVKWSYGRNELTMPDGSKWIVRAATPSAGHGFSPDLVIVDEIWDVGEEVVEQGLLPAQRARRSPLLSAWSTAGTEASKLFLRWREEGLRIIDTGNPGRLAFTEWSLPPGIDPMDERFWPWANPAIGHTIDIETLRAEADSPNRSAFLRASLNLWISTNQSWLPPGIWETLKTDATLGDPAVLAIDSSLDDSRYVGVFAWDLEDRTVVGTAFVCQSENELWAELDRVAAGKTFTIAITPTLDAHFPLEYARRKTLFGYGELQRWTSLVKAMIAEGRLAHTGEQALAEHINRAVAVRTQGTTVLSSQRSPGPIELARCAVAAAAIASKAKWRNAPEIVFG